MKLAFLVPDLGFSQLNAALIPQANALLKDRPDCDIVLLYESLCRPCVTPHFAVMQAAEGFGFDGPVVATTFTGADKLSRFPSPSKKLFLVWDLEWLRDPKRPFREWAAVYRNPDLTLLARGADHANVISRCWNRPVAAVDGFNLQAIMGLAT